MATNIEQQARQCNILFIWTDCDREGEHIGTEIRDIAIKANPRLEVWRARFSNIERAYANAADPFRSSLRTNSTTDTSSKPRNILSGSMRLRRMPFQLASNSTFASAQPSHACKH